MNKIPPPPHTNECDTNLKRLISYSLCLSTTSQGVNAASILWVFIKHSTSIQWHSCVPNLSLLGLYIIINLLLLNNGYKLLRKQLVVCCLRLMSGTAFNAVFVKLTNLHKSWELKIRRILKRLGDYINGCVSSIGNRALSAVPALSLHRRIIPLPLTPVTPTTVCVHSVVKFILNRIRMLSDLVKVMRVFSYHKYKM